jgi:hypothetical protein
VNVTAWPTWGEDEETWKIVDNGSVAKIVTDRELVEVCVGVDESFAVSVIVNDCAEV